MNLFFEQIIEDIKNIQSEFDKLDKNLNKDEYAFNYWILSRIFSIDEELIPNLITEYNDKGIDCFVHYEESKELYIIQNKFYNSDTAIKREQVSDFLTTPYTLLKNNTYKKSQELQDIFNTATQDSEYKIFFYFFTTTNKISEDIKKIFFEFNNDFIQRNDFQYYRNAKIFNLIDIQNLYFGKNYKKDNNFKYSLSTINKGTIASIKEQYNMKDVMPAYYIVTPITELYEMINKATNEDYSIFEKNIREYLGKNAINNGIIETLKSKEERKNFLYYNNGITIICDAVETGRQNPKTNKRELPLINPQIINGCQTVNSIVKVLENLSKSEIENEYKDVYVMLKVLVITDKESFENKNFYYNVVKYTNKQNAISEKAFAANIEIFYSLKREFEKRGFLLIVKASDKYSYKNFSKEKEKELLIKANKFTYNLEIKFNKISDIQIDLEKLLQVYLALIKNGYFAYTKKNLILKQNSEIFKEYSLTITENLTVENLIRLFLLYKRAEEAKKQSGDKRSPIPYYLIGFLGEIIKNEINNNLQNKLELIFSTKDNFDTIFDFLKKLTSIYQEKIKNLGIDYNVMIKQPINEEIFKEQLSTTQIFMPKAFEILNR